MANQPRYDPMLAELESLSAPHGAPLEPSRQPHHVECHGDHEETLSRARAPSLFHDDPTTYASSNNSTDESRSTPTVRAEATADTASRPPTPSPIYTRGHSHTPLGQDLHDYCSGTKQPLTRANIEALNNATWSPLNVWVETNSLPDRLYRHRIPLSTKVKKGTVDTLLSETESSWVEVVSPQSDRTDEVVIHTGTVFGEPSSL